MNRGVRSLAIVAGALAGAACTTKPPRDSPFDPSSPSASPGSVVGTVSFDEVGAELGDVPVTAAELRVEGLAAANADSTGRMRIEGVRAGDHAVEVVAPYTVPVRFEAVTVSPGLETDVGAITLRRGRGQVSGRILVSGREVPSAGCPDGSVGCGDHSGAQVSVADHPAAEPRFTVTNLDGAYQIADVAAGKRRLAVRRDGYDPAVIEFELLPADRKRLPDYTIGRGFSAKVQGDVLLDDRDPGDPAYAAIRAELAGGVASAFCDDAGRFVVSSPLGGDFDLIVRRDEYETVVVPSVPVIQNGTVDLTALLGAPIVLRRAIGAAKGQVSVAGSTNDGVTVCEQGTFHCAVSTVPEGQTLGGFRISALGAGTDVQLQATKTAGGRTYTGQSAGAKRIAAGPATDFGTIFLSLQGGDFRLRGRADNPVTGKMEPDTDFTKEDWVAIDLTGIDTTGKTHLARTFAGTPSTWLPLVGTTAPDCTDPARQTASEPLCVMVPGQGRQTLTLLLSDRAGVGPQTLGPLTGSIVYDTSAPTNVSLKINGDAAYVNAQGGTTLALEADARDALSPLRWMRIATASDPAAPDLATAAAVAFTKSPPAVNIPDPATENRKTVTLRVYDAAGNAADATGSIVLDKTAPSGVTVFVVTPTPGYVDSSLVTLTLDRTGASDVSVVRLSNAQGMLPRSDVAFVGAAATVQTPWSLLGGDGDRTVYAVFVDAAGNLSTPLSATVKVDTALPAQPVLLVSENPCTGAPTDILPNGFTRNPRVCVTVVADPDTDHLEVTGCATARPTSTTQFECQFATATDGAKAIGVTAVDPAANRSPTAAVYLTLDRTPPGAPTFALLSSPDSYWPSPTAPKYVNGPVVVYRLAPAAFEPLEVQIDQSAPVAATTPWYPFAPVGVHLLSSATNGVHKVKARVRDLAENVSPDSAEQAVTLDTVAPTTPAVTPQLPGFTNQNPLAGRTLSSGDDNLWRYEVLGGPCTSLTAACVVAVPAAADGGAASAPYDFALTPNPFQPDVIRVRARDLAGNAGAESLHLVTHDSLAPEAPVVSDGGVPAVVNADVLTLALSRVPRDPAAAADGGTHPDNFAYVEVATTSGIPAAPPCPPAGGIPSPWSASGSATSVTMALAQNAENRLCLRSVDSAGNRSAGAATEVAVAEDSIPPPAPVFGPGVGSTTVVNADTVFLWLLQPTPSAATAGYDPGNHFDHFEVIGGLFADWTWLPLSGGALYQDWGPDNLRSPYDARNFYEIPLAQDADNFIYFRAVDRARNASTASPVLEYRDESNTAVVGATGDIRGAAIWGDRIAWSTQAPSSGVFTWVIGQASQTAVPGYTPFTPDFVSLWGLRIAFHDVNLRVQDFALSPPPTAPSLPAATEPWIQGDNLVWIDTATATNCVAETGPASRRVCRCRVDPTLAAVCASGTIVRVSQNSARSESMPRIWGDRIVFADSHPATTQSSQTGDIWTCAVASGCTTPTQLTSSSTYLNSLTLAGNAAVWGSAPATNFSLVGVWKYDFAVGSGAAEWNVWPSPTLPPNIAAWANHVAWSSGVLGPPVAFRRRPSWPDGAPGRRASRAEQAGRAVWGVSGHRIVYEERATGAVQLAVHDAASLRKLALNGASRWEGNASGGFVVWTDFRNGNNDVFLFDRQSGIETHLSDGNPASQDQPAVASVGGTARAVAVWRDTRLESNGDIYGCKMGSCKAPEVVRINADTSPAVQQNPDIACTTSLCRVVWEDGRSGAAIYVASFDPTGTPLAPVESPVPFSGGRLPSISGDRVVYEAGGEIRLRYLGSNAADPAYPCRISGGVECRVSSGGSPSYADIDGDWVVWQKGSPPTAIAGYNLAAGFTAAGAPIGTEATIASGQPPAQMRPTVSAKTIAWQAKVGLDQDVLIHDLDTAATFRISFGGNAVLSSSFDRPRAAGSMILYTSQLGSVSDVLAWEQP